MGPISKVVQDSAKFHPTTETQKVCWKEYVRECIASISLEVFILGTTCISAIIFYLGKLMVIHEFSKRIYLHIELKCMQ